MILYRLLLDFNGMKAGTTLTFNRSQQRFENLSHSKYVTNREAIKNPGIICIFKELTIKSERKKHFFNIPF